jgi:hypothetical protein
MIEKFELFELMYLMTLSTAEVCFTLAANVGDLLYSLQTEKNISLHVDHWLWTSVILKTSMNRA